MIGLRGLAAPARTIKWCCEGFKAAHQWCGRRGYSIFYTKGLTKEERVVLQFRAVDKGSEAGIGPTKVPLTRVTEVVLTFCPWCGVNLSTYYGKNLELMRRPDCVM